MPLSWNSLFIVLWFCLLKRILQKVRICCGCCTQDLIASAWVCGCVCICICAMSVCFLCGCNIIMFCLFRRKWSNQLWQSVCDSWSGVYQSTSQIFGTVNWNWAVHEVQEVIQCGIYCSVLHLYQQLYLWRFMELNVCLWSILSYCLERENIFLLLDSHAQVLTWLVDDLTVNPYTRMGRSDAQNPYGVMSPLCQRQTLHLEASLKPLQLTLNMSCHQHSSPKTEKTFRWKSVSNRRSQLLYQYPCNQWCTTVLDCVHLEQSTMSDSLS